MTWTFRLFIDMMRRLTKARDTSQPESGAQPEDPYAYAGVRNRPRKPTQSGAVAVELEP